MERERGSHILFILYLYEDDNKQIYKWWKNFDAFMTTGIWISKIWRFIYYNFNIHWYIYISVCFVEGATNVFITAYCIKKIYSNRSHLLSLLEYSSFQELMRMNARATILSRTRKLVGRQSLSISARNYRNSCIYIFPFLFSHFSFFMEEVAILGDCNILMMGRKQHCTTALLLWCVSLSSLLLLRRP